MKILLIYDGSSYSETATRMLEGLKLPPQTEIIVMTVIPEPTCLGGITIGKLWGTAQEKEKDHEEEAAKILPGPVQLLRESGLKVASQVRRGNPANEVVKAAEEYDVSLIVMGTKGVTNYPAFRLGSVCQNVMKQARTNILIARKKTARADKLSQTGESSINIDRILFATDGSKYADMAAGFLMALPAPRQCEINVLTVLQSYIAALQKVPTTERKTYQKMLDNVQAAEEEEAKKIIARSVERFTAEGYRTASMIMRGAAEESILKAANEYGPDIITVGCRGLSGIESLFMGSVSERIVRHAPCSVIVVKR